MGLALATLTLVVVSFGSPAVTAHASTIESAPVPASPSPSPEPPPVPVTVNEFLPENQNLGECLGALERPGCGSKARGGWRQAAVFGAMAVGLVVVFARIAISVRRRNQPA